MLRAAVTTAVILALAQAVGSEEVHPAWSDYRATFVEVPCPFKDAVDYDPEGVTCGTLLVPEDRTDPGSRLIQLSAAVVAGREPDAAVGPTVSLSGGPGGPGLPVAGALAARPDHPLRAGGDFVVMDQRGVGWSEAGFCRAIPFAYNTGLPSGEAEEAVRDTLRRCLAEARQRGIDVDAYATWDIALDHRDLRLALGLERWNVFGVSYGTELGQMLLQVDPDGVRAAVFDSVVPAAGVGWDTNSVGMATALKALDDACREHGSCHARFGDLRELAERVVRTYVEDPLVVDGLEPDVFIDGRVILDGTLAGQAIFQALYISRWYADLPTVLESFLGRDADRIRAYVPELAVPRDHLWGHGMQAIVNCAGAAPATREQVAQRREAEPFWSDVLLDGYWSERCESLGLPGPPDPPQPLVTGIPVLVLAGAVDPITPPQYGQAIMAGLHNGHYVELPYAGHGVVRSSRPCSQELYDDFLAEPTSPPDTTCVEELPPPSFVTGILESRGPLNLVRATEEGTALVPAVWAGGSAATLVVALVGFPLAWLGRRLDRAPSTGAAARVVAWLSALSGLLGLAIVAWAAYDTASSHPMLLPLGLLAWARWGGWLALAGAVLGATAVLQLLRGTRGTPALTWAGVLVTGLGAIALCAMIVSHGLGPL